jgi:hypothetical protein
MSRSSMSRLEADPRLQVVHSAAPVAGDPVPPGAAVNSQADITALLASSD